ncbi:cysteine--tRNA ligase [Pelagicoccus sp. SDUM812002]|uniref:cysteine--tRNA ligase n=1 Tax=Pelagicoccus sp. SDUM812002 TaxID=3041266 RepID=UPI00280E1E96|nr:cysteine--tRNA ligase [Pelagicoccus sp. SDUM812002]MDQ8184151.1 cysteine--tRNA ligase [Pelagicoccus sp. SDUM812002]
MQEVTFHNTLSRKAEPIVPTKGNVVGMYCCGPTVYAQAHIGNFRTFLNQDVMRRVLQTAGYKVIHVRNLTDVDDKTIARSIEEGRPLIEFTEHWTEVFHKDCDRFNMLAPQIEPKATAHIQEQIKMIEDLIERGHAYASEDGSVYFSVSSFDGYGKLSRIKDRELLTDATPNDEDKGAVDADEYSRDSAADFVMWKSRKPTDGDVYWESPWGEGRPGWHLECSAMAMKYLANNLDIHSGGVDLTFPHHENEIAQSECSCGHQKQFFKYWIHAAHLLVDNAKMSKSLNNFFTVDDIEAKGYAPVVLRYALTSGHYRQTINFNADSLVAAQSALVKLRKFSDEILTAAGLKRSAVFKEINKGKHLHDDWGQFADAWQKLSHDMNIPGALGGIFTAMKSKPGAEAVVPFHKLIFALGYDLDQVVIGKSKVEAPKEIKAIAQKRWEAKQAKDWGAADALRDELAAAGWKALDGKDGFVLEKV